MSKLRFVSAQPAADYYSWQVEVMINNFIEMGVNPNDMDIVCWKPNGVISNEWSKLANNYPARFFFYADMRETKHYISSIRPNILKQHWLKYPELKEESIFYHDCDIIFTKPIQNWITDEMITDTKWYGSDTRWYIGHDYIIGKGEDVLSEMCRITNIDRELVKSNELNSIGAQYLMKQLDFDFWDEVERDSETLYKEITDLNNHKISLDPSHHPLQIWCADMFAVLWNGWKRGNETICHPNFDFSWGTSTEDDYHKLNIMHNAGVTNSTSGLFYKGEWIDKLPYLEPLKINEGTASKKYWEWIEKTANKSVLL